MQKLLIKSIAIKKVLVYNRKHRKVLHMEKSVKRRSGRPKKTESEKVRYQRIAVYVSDYEELLRKIKNADGGIAKAFSEMVKRYPEK